MKRFLMVIALLIALGGMSFAQQKSTQPMPDSIDGFLGRQLIAWTEMQKPNPLNQDPKPLPPPDTKPDAQTPAAPPSGQDAPKADSPQAKADAPPIADSINGTIAKAGSKYVLQTADSSTFQLDDQAKAKQYDGKRVKITGVMDRTAKTIRVSEIEVLS